MNQRKVGKTINKDQNRNSSSPETDRDDTCVVRYPLVEGKKNFYPEDGLCPGCRSKPVLEPNTFVALQGGAMLMDRKEDFGGPSDSLDGFLELASWHSGHNGDDNVLGEGALLPLVQNVQGGQFGLFCFSISCLRKVLNDCLDTMEKMIASSQGTETA